MRDYSDTSNMGRPRLDEGREPISGCLGTDYSYRVKGCRCDTCRGAHAEYHLSRTKAVRAGEWIVTPMPERKALVLECLRCHVRKGRTAFQIDNHDNADQWCRSCWEEASFVAVHGRKPPKRKQSVEIPELPKMKVRR